MFTKTYIADDGIPLVANIAGDTSASTVILMHGGGQTRHSWSGTIRMLAAAGYHVIAYDARGHGESGWSADGDYSYDIRARDLRVIIRSISGPFALIGASMGGITSMQAIGEGMRPAALVLVDIVLSPEIAGIERIRNFMTSHPEGFPDLESVIDAVAAYNPNRPRPSDPSSLMHNLRRGEDGRLRWHWDPKILPAGASDDLARIGRVVELFERQQEVPIMLVRGKNSDVLSDKNVTDFQRAFPEARVMEVSGAGHMVAGDSNDVFTAGVIRYLRPYLGTSRQACPG